MDDGPRLPLPRWVAPILVVAAAGLIPWTLYLTYTLPARHVARHYDLAWIGYDIVLACAFAWSAWCAWTGSRWLVAAAAVTGTMLLCDAWFDVVTSGSGGERTEAVLEACFAELPLAALCAWVVYDGERFIASLVLRRERVRRRGRG